MMRGGGRDDLTCSLRRMLTPDRTDQRLVVEADQRVIAEVERLKMPARSGPPPRCRQEAISRYSGRRYTARPPRRVVRPPQYLEAVQRATVGLEMAHTGRTGLTARRSR